MKLDDELLSRAARIVRDRELAALPHEDLCPDYDFSEKFEQEMKELLDKLERGDVKQIIPPMGWRYYMRNGIAAVLIGFFLTCMVAPDVVEAAYQKLIEVIETVITEYTDIRYDSSETAESEFKQATLNYLPEGFELENYLEKEKRYHVYYRFDEEYFNLEQIILTEEREIRNRLDTENVESEIKYIGQDKLRFVLKNGIYRYTWIHDIYLIKGQSSLSIDEIMKILENVTFE